MSHFFLGHPVLCNITIPKKAFKNRSAKKIIFLNHIISGLNCIMLRLFTKLLHSVDQISLFSAGSLGIVSHL